MIETALAYLLIYSTIVGAGSFGFGVLVGWHMKGRE